MNRLRLTRIEKRLFIRISQGDHDNFGLDKYVYLGALLSLQSLGLVEVKIDYDKVVDVRMTLKGRAYIINNPKLNNPTDWKFIITTVIQAIIAIATTIALFIACTLTK